MDTDWASGFVSSIMMKVSYVSHVTSVLATIDALIILPIKTLTATIPTRRDWLLGVIRVSRSIKSLATLTVNFLQHIFLVILEL